jgi:hypothetical protein
MDGIDLPIILVKKYSDNQVRFYCKNCKRYHLHGLDNELLNGKLSHRVSHCHNQYEGGYYLKLETIAPKKSSGKMTGAKVKKKDRKKPIPLMQLKCDKCARDIKGKGKIVFHSWVYCNECAGGCLE